jgi:L-alanine-DL-glutamate epimerase-like enolase superfamily enzyme
VALDEPLARGLTQEQVSLVAPDVVVLKPMALGGFSACVKIAEWAQRERIALCVSHLFDGNVAMGATIQLAFAVQTPKFATGLGEHVALASDPSGAPGATGFSAGSLACPAANGIGDFTALTS